VYASYYLTRQSFNAAKVVLADGPLHIGREQLGRIDATYLSVYSLGQFIFGPLADRFGPRKVLLAGMGLSVLAAVGFGFSTSLAAFLAFAALQGVAQSNELVVFGARTWTRARLVVHALHGRRGIRHTVRRLAGGYLGAGSPGIRARSRRSALLASGLLGAGAGAVRCHDSDVVIVARSAGRCWSAAN
jgi:MFS family permease